MNNQKISCQIDWHWMKKICPEKAKRGLAGLLYDTENNIKSGVPPYLPKLTK